MRDRLVKELLLGRTRPEWADRGPLLVVGQTPAGEQIVGLTTGVDPLVQCDHQSRMRGDIIASLLDPAAQSWPLMEERFVGHLDGG